MVEPMGYPILRRNMRRAVRDALLGQEIPRAWGRKVGATMGEEGTTVVPTGAIWGTFSRRNHSELGWVEHHSHQAQAYFPNDEHGMDRYADWSGVSQARMLVTVTKAGRVDSKMHIAGSGIDFTPGLWVPLDSLGVKISPWRDVSLQDGPEALTHWIVENPEVGETPGSDPPSGIDFMESAPGNLTVEGTSYYGDWCVAQTNFGYSHAEASALIHSFLDDPAGWAAAGITFREVSEAEAKVRFRVVQEARCGVPELACTHYYSDHSYVELEYGPLNGTSAPIGPGNIINHEAGHTFFYASHTGNGVMGDLSAGAPEKPTATDIANVETWLGTPGEPGAGTFAVGLCQLQVR